MLKRIVALLLLGVILYLGYRFFEREQQRLRAESGDFTCQGCDSPEEHARFLKENAGETADGASERKTDSARVAAQKAIAGESSQNEGSQDGTAQNDISQNGTIQNGPGMRGNSTARPSASSMMAPDSGLTGSDAAPVASAPVVVPTTGQPGGLRHALPPGLPAGDTESPLAPNGMRFAGSGSYQWYRQGNLTWRVDTTTGRSCIIYATMDEWRKQIVMSHGCGRDA